MHREEESQHGNAQNRLLLMPSVPLNMQTTDNGIHRTVGTGFLALLLNKYTVSNCALCCDLLVNNYSDVDE